MRRLAVLLTALALPAGAIAKEPVKATVCGANGCNSSKDALLIMPLAEGGPAAAEVPKTVASAYRVSVTISMDDGSKAQKGMVETITSWVIPELDLMRGEEGEWVTPSAATLAALRTLARDLKPFPASRVPGGGFLPVVEEETQGGGALPPQTYTVPPSNPPDAAAGGTDWGLITGLGGAGIAALTAGGLLFARRRRREPPAASRTAAAS